MLADMKQKAVCLWRALALLAVREQAACAEDVVLYCVSF